VALALVAPMPFLALPDAARAQTGTETVNIPDANLRGALEWAPNEHRGAPTS